MAKKAKNGQAKVTEIKPKSAPPQMEILLQIVYEQEGTTGSVNARFNPKLGVPEIVPDGLIDAMVESITKSIEKISKERRANAKPKIEVVSSLPSNMKN